jgi:hypothetical protein
MTYQLTIEYGDDVLLNMGMRKEEFDQEARFLLAAKLYDEGKGVHRNHVERSDRRGRAEGAAKARCEVPQRH